MIFKSHTEKDTEKIAADIANLVKDFRVICLYGEMGAGKTFFTKSLSKALGVTTRIISPTYIFVRTHKAKDINLYHIDAFRLSELDNNNEIKEILDDESAIIVIEWADKIKNILPEKRLDIEFIHKNNDEREIRVKKIH